MEIYITEHPERLSSRIAGLAESLECGDGGVRGDFRTALAEVDALAEQLQRAKRERDEYREGWLARGRDLNALFDKIAEIHHFAKDGRVIVDVEPDR